MFDNNVFIEGSCKNVTENNEVKGFEVQTHITYYRGVPLSMVNEVRVRVDGQAVPAEQIRCSVDQNDWFSLSEMETVTTYKWEYGEPLYIRVLNGSGLAKGKHEVELAVVTRTAYIPIPLEGIKKREVLIS
ncbi:MAG: C-glycoside deglycosidase beta subunit domain-containing protein [Lachnospiraceae bacterium]